jgi:hypothetical protein
VETGFPFGRAGIAIRFAVNEIKRMPEGDSVDLVDVGKGGIAPPLPLAHPSNSSNVQNPSLLNDVSSFSV